MKKYFCALLLLLALGSSAQQSNDEDHYADSLITLLQKTSANTAKANLFFLLSDYWSDKDSAKGVDYALRALQLPLDNYHKGLASFYLGSAYFDYDINKAEQEYGKVENLLEAYPTREALLYRSRAWANIAAMAQRRNENREYIDILLNKSIPLAARAGDSLRMASQYMNVGLPFMNYKEYDKAIAYYRKALDIFARHHTRSLTVADCYCNAAKAYLLSGRTPPARPLLDSARAILGKERESVYHTYYYCQEGLYYTRSKEWTKAEQNLAKGLSMARSQHQSRDVLMLLFGYVDLYTYQKKLPELKKILLELQNNEKSLSIIEHQQILLGLATADAGSGNEKSAYGWLWKYTTLTDSLNKAHVNLQLTELEARFNYAAKEKELLRLSERSKMQRILLWGSFAIILLAALSFIYFYKQRKNKTEQQLRSLQQKQQIAVTQALLDGEERERARMARDLHDGLGGMLAGVKINLSEITREDNLLLNKVTGQLDHSITELRRIARNMMPESLLRSGLETGIRDLCQSVATTQMNVELQMIDIERDLPVQVQLIIYRIVQELLANVLKHAAASEVFIQCSQLADIFYITIEDNGKGFDATAIPDYKKGIGLDNVRNRVEFLHGKIDIRSAHQKGTIINIELLCRNN